MACAVHLKQNIVFTVIFHIACISCYKRIKSVIISTRKLQTQNKINIASCLPVILLEINVYSLSETTVLQNQRRI